MLTKRSSSLAAVSCAVWLAVSLSCAPPGARSPGETSAPSDGALEAAGEALHAVRELADQRKLGAPALATYLADPREPVVVAALMAVGRMADRTYVPEVSGALEDQRPAVRRAAAFALGLLGGEVEGTLLVRLQDEAVPTVKAEVALALGRAGTPAALSSLEGLLAEGVEPEVQAAACSGIAALVGRLEQPLSQETVLRLLTIAGSAPDEVARRAALAVGSVPDGEGAAAEYPEAESLAAFQSARSSLTRVELMRVLRRLGTPAANERLVLAAATEQSVVARASAYEALGRVAATPAVLERLLSGLSDPSVQVAVVAAQSLTAHAASATQQSKDVAARLASAQSPWLRAELLTLLVSLDLDAARPFVELALEGSDPLVRVAALSGLARYASAEDVARLTAALSDGDVRIVESAINALASLGPDAVPAESKEALRRLLRSKAPGVVGTVAFVASSLGWKDFAPDIVAAYDDFIGPTALEGRYALMYAIGALGSEADLPFVERGLEDSERVVAEVAAQSYAALGGGDVSERVPLASKVTVPTPSAAEIERALGQRVTLVTERGDITLRMLPDAPVTAAAFVRWVEAGYYEGLDFHRVIPAFVAQGGSPLGDGAGGADSLVREEISHVPHDRGSVGIATLGKDTGSGQFFINQGANHFLDGSYTVFARVEEGMDIVDRVELGDRILSAFTSKK